MRVHVDGAGHHVPAGRVDRSVRLDRHAGTDRRDPPSVHEDVGSHRLGRRHDRAALDQRLHELAPSIRLPSPRSTYIRSVFIRSAVIR
jgi:hypothetical protein